MGGRDRRGIGPDETMNYQLINDDSRDAIAAMADNSIDSVVCDPPYEIAFMGKGWDNTGIAYDQRLWSEVFRVLKPGGHLIAFSATRTVHRMTCAIEDAGFHIRDQIAWMNWQGFPKSLDVSKAIDRAAGAEREVVGTLAAPAASIYSQGAVPLPSSVPITTPATEAAKQWDGWGTALKPAYEPAVLARKPPEGTIADNVRKWGTGAINVDGCRYGYKDPAWPGPNQRVGPRSVAGWGDSYVGGKLVNPISLADPGGRWPANVYQCPKPTRTEREAGCEGLQCRTAAEAVDRAEGSAGMESPRAGAGRTAKGGIKNHHPTVKPIGVLRWLVRMVTPPGGVVLDPFNGSGSTGCACALEGFDYIGIDMEAEYIKISEARIKWWHDQRTPTAAEAKAMDSAGRRPAKPQQIGLFGAEE